MLIIYQDPTKKADTVTFSPPYPSPTSQSSPNRFYFACSYHIVSFMTTQRRASQVVEKDMSCCHMSLSPPLVPHLLPIILHISSAKIRDTTEKIAIQQKKQTLHTTCHFLPSPSVPQWGTLTPFPSYVTITLPSQPKLKILIYMDRTRLWQVDCFGMLQTKYVTAGMDLEGCFLATRNVIFNPSFCKLFDCPP